MHRPKCGCVQTSKRQTPVAGNFASSWGFVANAMFKIYIKCASHFYAYFSDLVSVTRGCLSFGDDLNSNVHVGTEGKI